MKKNKLQGLIVLLTLVIVIAAVVGYGVLYNWDYSRVTGPFIKLFLSFLEFINNYIANPDFTFPNVLYMVAIIVGPLLAVFLFVSQLIRKDYFAALLGITSPLLLVYALIGLFIPYYPNIPNDLNGSRPYFDIFLEDITNNLERAIIFGFVFGLTIIVTTFIILTFIFSRRYKGKLNSYQLRKTALKVSKQSQVSVTAPLVTPTTQTTFASPTLPTSVPEKSSGQIDLQLTELVKLVLSEELSNPRQVSTYNSYSGHVCDPNLIRRIVTEELAKFQTHFITRAEAQTMVAQELAALKLQLKLK